jgi:hypothetical protein
MAKNRSRSETRRQRSIRIGRSSVTVIVEGAVGGTPVRQGTSELTCSANRRNPPVDRQKTALRVLRKGRGRARRQNARRRTAQRHLRLVNAAELHAKRGAPYLSTLRSGSTSRQFGRQAARPPNRTVAFGPRDRCAGNIVDNASGEPDTVSSAAATRVIWTLVRGHDQVRLVLETS